MNFGVIVFPGSNCDHDCLHVISNVLGQKATPVWHKETALAGLDAVILPGGFSYGDYLRTGAIARFSPVMNAVQQFAKEGGMVLGICNGFQILTEAGLLPGALLRNESLRFVCRDVYLRVERRDTCFTSACAEGEVLRIPIAHGDGNFFADEEVLKRIEGEGLVLFRYADSRGQSTPASNPNGSLNNIAGIMNPEGNVLGLMPHPERAVDPLLGNTDGRRVFESVISSISAGRHAVASTVI
jgi:phosphoribosylformylglycinamidine synthase